MKQFILSPDQRLSKIVDVRPVITPEWPSQLLRVTIPNTTTARFPRWLNVSRFQLTVICMFFQSTEKRIGATSQQLPDQTINRRHPETTLTFQIPPETKTIMIVLKCAGVISVTLSRDKRANGIDMVEVVNG